MRLAQFDQRFPLTLNLVLVGYVGLNGDDLASEIVLRLGLFGSLFKNVTPATSDVRSGSVVSESCGSREAETSSSAGNWA
jgi:hypothetical protein